MALDRSRHPCFDAKARHSFGRIHLPVAPKCNVQCNFCDRRYDCPNESRPGVTSDRAAPPQALSSTWAGPRADPRPRRRRHRRARATRSPTPTRRWRPSGWSATHDPDVLLCVATNGLHGRPVCRRAGGPPGEPRDVTINAVDPEIVQRIYAWMRDGTRVVRGLEAARLLLGRQLEAVRALKERGRDGQGQHDPDPGRQRRPRRRDCADGGRPGC